MALTFTKIRDFETPPGAPVMKLYRVRLDDSYSTGGWAVTAANVGLTVLIGGWTVEIDTYMSVKFDRTTKKLIATSSHNSTGVGGHELNNASANLNNKLVDFYVLGS